MLSLPNISKNCDAQGGDYSEHSRNGKSVINPGRVKCCDYPIGYL